MPKKELPLAYAYVVLHHGCGTLNPLQVFNFRGFFLPCFLCTLGYSFIFPWLYLLFLEKIFPGSGIWIGTVIESNKN